MQQLILVRPKEEDEKWGGEQKEENVRVFLQNFESAVEVIEGVTDRQKYEELKQWTKGKAKTYVLSLFGWL